jgi:hypothetical protein
LHTDSVAAARSTPLFSIAHGAAQLSALARYPSARCAIGDSGV